MDLKPNSTTQDYLYFDPKVVKGSGTTEVPKNRAPFEQAIVFMVCVYFTGDWYLTFRLGAAITSSIKTSLTLPRYAEGLNAIFPMLMHPSGVQARRTSCMEPAISWMPTISWGSWRNSARSRGGKC